MEDVVMNSERFKIQNSLEANYLCVEMREPIRLDAIAMRVLKADCPDFLIPYQVKTINDQFLFRYRLMNTVALEYSNMTLPKSAFLKMYKSLLIPFINGRDWFLDYHNLCVDPRYVYLNRSGDKAYFVYVPEGSFRNTDEEIITFFRKVFTKTMIIDDKDFQVRLYQYFAADENITLAGLYQLILDEIKEDVPVFEQEVSPQRQDSAKQIYSQVKTSVAAALSQAVSSVKTEVSEKAAKEENVGRSDELVLVPDENKNDKVMDVVFGDATKTKEKKEQEKEKKKKKEKEKTKSVFGGGFFKKKKDAVVISEELGGTGEIGVRKEVVKKPKAVGELVVAGVRKVEMSDETETEGDDMGIEFPHLELMSSEMAGAPGRIDLNFPGQFIIIGRTSSDEVKPDVAFPEEFKRIGRRHVRIDKGADGYYLIDLGSSNHTFLDGKMLVPNQQYRLCNGMVVQFTESKPVRYRVCVQE